MFFVANMLQLACHFINQYKELTDTVRLFAFAPSVVIDCVFLVWSAHGLRRTMAYLMINEHMVKFRAMKFFACIFMLFVFVRFSLITVLLISYGPLALH